jgi:hypothetical protein
MKFYLPHPHIAACRLVAGRRPLLRCGAQKDIGIVLSSRSVKQQLNSYRKTVFYAVRAQTIHRWPAAIEKVLRRQ